MNFSRNEEFLKDLKDTLLNENCEDMDKMKKLMSEFIICEKLGECFEDGAKDGAKVSMGFVDNVNVQLEIAGSSMITAIFFLKLEQTFLKDEKRKEAYEFVKILDQAGLLNVLKTGEETNE